MVAIGNTIISLIFAACIYVWIGEECGVKAQDRTDCGWLGINKAECNKRGCCWDDKTKKAQFCFYPKSKYALVNKDLTRPLWKQTLGVTF